MNLITPLLFAFIFISCKNLSVDAQSSQLVIQLDQKVSKEILGKKWVISLVSIDENSLCPPKMQCVWAGRLIVTLNINGEIRKLGAGDLFIKENEQEIPRELVMNHTSISIVDSFEKSTDTPWIKLFFEKRD